MTILKQMLCIKFSYLCTGFFKDKGVKATLGKKLNVVVALNRNEEINLEALDKRSRKAAGAKLDILLKFFLGLEIELVILDYPVGRFITRVVRTQKLELFLSVDTFAADFLPLMEIAWKGKELMKRLSWRY
ncbi:hypothetical protein BD770DRAFT_432584 [Pilaira anomala]|nr:hypothetical protein BD770DRAFT_432584 [Pilaira anomala]